jgi:hypothetical protein
MYQLASMSAAYLSGGADYWATFVESGNHLGSYCFSPTHAPTLLPTFDGDEGNDDNSSNLPDEAVIAAIGSLLFIGLIATLYLMRKFFLYFFKSENKADVVCFMNLVSYDSFSFLSFIRSFNFTSFAYPLLIRKRIGRITIL